MRFEYWGEGVVFILIFLAIVAVPCVGAALIGYRMINKLGHFPSKTPAIQMSILLKLIVIEIISFAMIILFYHVFSSS